MTRNLPAVIPPKKRRLPQPAQGRRDSVRSLVEEAFLAGQEQFARNHGKAYERAFQRGWDQGRAALIRSLGGEKALERLGFQTVTTTE